MPIQQIRCHRVTVPLHTPFVTALRRTTTVDSLLVELIDDEGRSGWGEAPEVWRVTGESMAGAEACCLGPLRAVLVGRDPDDLQPLLQAVAAAVPGNRNAKAAVDVALHDLVARRAGLSLTRFLGGTTRRIPTDVTLSADDAAGLATAAATRVSEGFTVLKAKVGTHAREDVARVRAIREAVGPDVTIRLDANQGWTPRDAVRAISAMEDAGLAVELVEQPVAAADLDGLAFVTSRVDTPILADESVFDVRDLVEMIRRRAADLVNVKLAKCGGIAQARTLLSLARTYGIGTMVGSMMEGPVGVGAAAALVASDGTSLVSDLDAAWWTSTSPIRGGLRYDGADVVLPDAPGLGIDGLADVTAVTHPGGA
ncbi:MAG TPA: dipeptide epimerase [Actinopolymorphaceae bacterium]